MARYRLTDAAQADIVDILAWSHEQFGEQARRRYATLIVAAIRDAASRDAASRDAASRDDSDPATARADLGEGVFAWHLARSRTRGIGVRRPRHFLICRRDGDVLVIGRILHDAMDLRRHVDPQKI